MKTIKLVRDTVLPDRIFGTITIDDFTCKSGEKPWAFNKKNVSCIPCGVYECCRYWSRKYKNCLYVLGVENRTSILIHTMNWPNTESQGCIGVGMSLKDIDGDGVLELYQSRKALDNILDRLGNKERIVLEITEVIHAKR